MNDRRVVWVTRRIPEIGPRILRDAGFEVKIHDSSEPMPRAELERAAGEADGLLALLTDRIDDGLLANASRLKVVANLAVGVDNIDLAAAARRRIAVANTPDVLTDATADLAWALLLSCARRVVEGYRYLRQGLFMAWDPLLLRGMELRGRTLGIVGAGRIGRAVGRRAPAFGMSVLYASPSRKPEFERECGARKVGLDALLDASDVVSLHCPLTAATRHLIDAAAMARMKAGSVLVNTARGPIVDEKALVEALRRGRPGFAGLDVFEREPAVEPALLDMPNVVLLPHIGSATTETRDAMARLAATAIVDVLEGRQPANLVPSDNPKRGSSEFRVSSSESGQERA